MRPQPDNEQLRRAVADLSSRAESTLVLWNAHVRKQVKSRVAPARNADAYRIVEEEKLRQQLVQLERESAMIEEEYRAKQAYVDHWEERADIAMRHSDVVAAEEAHRVYDEHSVSLKALERELTILRALMRTCRDVL
jgi:phage shock protein A